MSISCSCGDDYEWMYHGPDDFEPLNTKRRRRCISCRTMIDVGADAGRFTCYHAPRSDYSQIIGIDRQIEQISSPKY